MTNTAHERARATPPADTPGGDRMGVPQPLPMPEYRFQQPATGQTSQSALYTPPQAGEREQIARGRAIIRQERLEFDAILALAQQAAPGVVEVAQRFLSAFDAVLQTEGREPWDATQSKADYAEEQAARDALEAILSAPQS